MKTVVKQILDKRLREFDVIKFIKWLDENRDSLLESEKHQIYNGFNEGTENYNEDSQDTINAEQYYKETYEQ